MHTNTLIISLLFISTLYCRGRSSGNIVKEEPVKKLNSPFKDDLPLLKMQRSRSIVDKQASGTVSECNTEQILRYQEQAHKFIGNGQQGFVFDLGDSVLKTQIFQNESNGPARKAFIKEIKLLNSLRDNPDIVTIADSCYIQTQNSQKYFIVLKKCEKEFHDYLKEIPKTVPSFLKVLLHITSILSDLNNQLIYHIDNHIGNFMICDGNIKLIDFGSAVKTKEPLNQYSFTEVRNLQITFSEIGRVFGIQGEVFEDLIKDMLKVGRYSKRNQVPGITIAQVFDRLQQIYQNWYNLDIKIMEKTFKMNKDVFISSDIGSPEKRQIEGIIKELEKSFHKDISEAA